ncbi:methyl-accepting chemotaxis protein [Marinicellulosiphila megalodicopiae]|uniref:methyl-accepting chemotaxis protein n=1 Tax=Marinicellulosiphila megalodicopiae TaxID=2724896 RepID=UPI003BAEBD16
MKSLRLTHIIMTASLLLAVIIGLQTLILERQSISSEKNLVDTQQVQIPILLTLKNIQISIIQVQQWLTDISATRAQDGLDDGFIEAEVAAQSFYAHIKSIIKLDPDNTVQYQKISNLFTPYYNSGKQMAQAYIDDGPNSGNKIMGKFDLTAEELTQVVDNAITFISSSVDQKILVQKDINARTQILIYVFASIIAITLMLFIIGAKYLIVNPASFISTQLNKIADGDFSVKIDFNKNNEFGDIAKATNRIVDHLGDNLRTITASGMQVSAYAHALTYAIIDSQEHLKNQSVETQNVITSIDQLALLGNTVENKSMEASQVSENVKMQTQNSRELIENSASSTTELAQRMKKAKDTVNDLAQSSNDITEVMSVIQGVAEQTNLLALNAAIEAARAGEQGRGFAVVADEVRNLASRTKESAQQINEMVIKLQSRAEETVALITANQEQAMQNAQSNEQVIKTLSKIFDAIDNLNELNANISDAAISQKIKADEVSENVIRSKSITDQYSESSKQFQRFSEQLTINARDFSSIAVKLKVF